MRDSLEKQLLILPENGILKNVGGNRTRENLPAFSLRVSVSILALLYRSLNVHPTASPFLTISISTSSKESEALQLLPCFFLFCSAKKIIHLTFSAFDPSQTRRG